MGYSYAKAGVDVRKVKGIHEEIAQLLTSTHTPEVILGSGHYAGLFRSGGKNLAVHTDSVGSKVLIAQQLQVYDTIGIDAIAMNVNDLICLGARPSVAVDYLAVERSDARMIREIMKGLAEGARQANCAIIGGETAILPDVIKGVDGRGFDLAVTCLGEIEGEPITGKDMAKGDVIVGLASSGLHSNGYGLARKVLLQGKNAADAKLLKELLTPTKIYTSAVLEMVATVGSINGLAHITGGAFSKLQRIGKYADKGFILDNMPAPPGIFKKIQEEGDVADKEMYRTFNMGIGFCVVCGEEDVPAVQRIAKAHQIASRAIGRVAPGKGVRLQRGKTVLDLTG